MRFTDLHVIAVESVPCRLRLGVSEDERAEPQCVRISVRAEIPEPLRFPAHDALAETLDYDAIICFLREGLPAQGPIRLIETVGDLVADYVLGLSAKIACVEVEVEKPSVLNGEGAVRVRLRRHGDRLTHRHALTLAGLAERQP